MKKMFAVLMALTLVLTLGVSLFTASVNAEEWNNTITIEGTTIVPVTGKTFNAYKILDAEAVDATDLSKGVLYAIPAALQAFYNTELALTDENDNPVAATIDDLVDYLEGIKNDADALQEFSVHALAAAKAAGVQAVPSVAGEGNTAVINSLPFGYYIVEDAGAATPISALMLKSTSAVVKIKADKPGIVKKIDGANDGDKTTTAPTDYNTAKVGETVPYILTSKVPEMIGYTAYTYTVTDTFSAGLTFNVDPDDIKKSVNVTVGGVAYDDYTVSVNGQTLTIDFPNFIDLADKHGDEIVITYSATVNENAVFGVAGNPNTVYLTYSNNPQSNTTDKTPDDTVYTYLVDLIINKTDENDVALPGALFEIRDKDNNVIASGESDANGLVAFTWPEGKGLKDGESYTIVETQAPAGYNEAKDISFAITCTDPTDGATVCTWNVNNDMIVYTNDRFETTIENSTGMLLPETGGIGTTIFYVVGSLLMVIAGVILVSKKRMGAYA